MRFVFRFFFIASLLSCAASAQESPPSSEKAEVRLRLVPAHPEKNHVEPVVVWLESLAGTPTPSFDVHPRYTLLQKNRTFIPHLQVIPVGGVVQFPNADPFFHNVFSLFDGKRFDLGLYEAGSSKSVTFSREGVSYIFCNIHPEMSAVVLALSTPLYAIADTKSMLLLRDVPPGDYRLHVWIEGVPQASLNRMSRPVHLAAHSVDLGELKIPDAQNGIVPHADEYGRPYRPPSKTDY